MLTKKPIELFTRARQRMAAVLYCLVSGCLLVPAGCAPHNSSTPTSGGIRVVSLAPSLTEMICAIGGASNLVGRTSACNYPPQAIASVPVIGGFGDPSIELLLSVHPTVIVDVALADAATGRKLEQVKIRREHIACRSLDDIPLALRKLGALLHQEAQAEAVAADIQTAVRRWRTMPAPTGRPLRVFVEVWNDPLTTAGRGSYISELIRLAGGVNIGDDTDRDYFQVSPEWVLARDPEVILCYYMGAQDARSAVLRRPGWNRVTAVRTGQVFDHFDNDQLLRPGPRVISGLEALHAALATCTTHLTP